MNQKPRFGPCPGERVRVKGERPYPLPAGLVDGDIVTITSWDRNYVVEKDGREFHLNQTQIVQPLLTCNGNRYCPECKARLWRRGQHWICSTRTCTFLCRVDLPASVMD